MTETNEQKSKTAQREMVQYPQSLVEFQQKIWGSYFNSKYGRKVYDTNKQEEQK